MSATALSTQRNWGGVAFAARAIKAVLRPLQLLTAAPCFLFLIALTAMLLRHPDVQFYEIDRVAFALLVIGVVGRAIVLRQPIFLISRASWPMLGLTLIALASAMSQPFDHEAWSLLASKFIVPFTMFHLAQLVFSEEKRLRHFETFALIVLAYLCFTSIAFLVGARSLIFPRFILDDTLGAHADRARGPLLQAVANGVSLNMLGVLAFHSYRRGRAKGVKVLLLLASVPVAILATMTRAVWLSFVATVIALIFLAKNRRARWLGLGLVIVGALGMVIVFTSSDLDDALMDRLEERGPVDFRQAVYAGSWQMFLERPLTGWGFHQMPDELPRYVSGYSEKLLYPHNTYLELLVEHGIVGLALYLWLIWELWRLGGGLVPASEKYGFLDRPFHCLWPVLLGVYYLNAAVVVMSYQFVNGLLFTLAGMLAAQRRRCETLTSC
jgi:putative inorganic carbon (hco3(-)) transporter